MIESLNGIEPKIGQNVFIAKGAVVLGQVTIGNNSSIWFNCVVRGDVGEILIGENCNIQDLSMLHITDDIALNIGDNVSVGHNVTLHSCMIENNCLIGMGAVVLDNAVIGKNSVVAANSLVPPGKVYPEKSLIMGNPAKVVRPLKEEEIFGYGNHYKSYIVTKERYIKSKKFNQLMVE
jgi:carbonic anhydrase/acetyltransferase-like protein (isoleucine patch superfamily)